MSSPRVVCTVIAAVLGCASLSFAGEPTKATRAHSIKTHLQITTHAVDYVRKHGLQCTDAQANELKTLLKIGAEHEDDWTFTHDQIVAELKRRGYGETAQAWLSEALQTMMLGRFNFHFTPRLTDGPVLASCSSFQWGFESNACEYHVRPNAALQKIIDLNELKLTLLNQHTWSHAVDAAKVAHQKHSDWAQGFEHLGYVMHLFQDQTSPAHARNDVHAYNDPDPMESTTTGSEVERIPDMPTGGPLAINDPKLLFMDLHKHVSTNFFSKSTVRNSPPDYSATAECSGEWIRYACKASRPVAVAFPEATVNAAVADEQWKELGPLAVRYSGSLILMYIKQTQPMMPCTLQ